MTVEFIYGFNCFFDVAVRVELNLRKVVSDFAMKSEGGGARLGRIKSVRRGIVRATQHNADGATL